MAVKIDRRARLRALRLSEELVVPTDETTFSQNLHYL
jgi:hypothetical protein